MTVTVQEAQADLLGLIRRLPPGEMLEITQGDKPVARLFVAHPAELRPPPGLAKGMLLLPEIDDDEHLKDFAEYMS